MIDVLVIPDFEKGHLFPTFKIVENLEKSGLQVCFLAVPEIASILKEYNFKVYTIFEDLYPHSSIENISTIADSKSLSLTFSKHYLALFNGKLDSLFKKLKPKLILVSYFISFEALIIHYKYKVETVIYHTLLQSLERNNQITYSKRTANNCIKTILNLSGDVPDTIFSFFRDNNISFSNFNDLVSPLETMSQFIICPDFFDIERPPNKDNEVFLGPSIFIDDKNRSQKFNQTLSRIPKTKKLLFVSMGTQTKQYPLESQFLLTSIVNCMSTNVMQNYHLILTVGLNKKIKNKLNVPKNVSVFDWLPQSSILKFVDLAIIHGGLGSIKECIVNGIPMIITPLGRDQMDNAKRVEHHSLGINMKDRNNIEALADKIDYLAHNNKIKSNIKIMQQRFLELEKKKIEVSFIHSLIKKKGDIASIDSV